ncbi:dTMP kinase [Planktothrix paucivesiculata]|uniref:Thymidylate kinase n=1 Tax=Planktothrix paucivesiculata PCC 9631 TaxID=671071 RepID=A0A7Z9DW20_9CYAN|nr:dTMP kinase [Planktothrix paucivesiculata]VXD13928.1 Thymidylate kinase [Planktothrix paucivesiculata PCC 9631]
MQGKLIVFEGVEGAGKTTQMQRIQARLQGLIDTPIVITREPGGTLLGQELRRLLLEYQGEEPIQNRAELLMYAADRAQHVQGFLKPLLYQGNIVLCDRYTDSTVAYQGYGRGLDLSLIDQLNQIATQGLESDLTLWLDVDVEMGLARTRTRGKMDRMEQANLEFHQRVQQGFKQLAQTHPDRIIPINGMLNLDVVTETIQSILIEKLTAWGFII